MKISSQHAFDVNAKFSNQFNVDVYKDTLWKASQYPFAATQKIKYKDIAFNINEIGRKGNRLGNVLVSNVDSVSTIISFKDSKTAVLNMASAKRPGGGVFKGAKAQEEALFRCSNLGVSIDKALYPLKEDELIYTKDAVFFKDFHLNDLECGYTCDVITCAAVNLNENAKYGYTGADINSTDAQNDPEYIKLVNQKIAAILDIAILHKIETLVLGAWGCGVFKNDPNFISQTFRDNLELANRRKCFDNIIFAVINDHNSVANNYDIFKKHLMKNEEPVV